MAKPSKQNININFAQGLDTKTDPKQVQVGKFLALENSIFDKGGLLQKRNGFGRLTPLPNAGSYLTTFNGALTAIQEALQVYSPASSQWVTKGLVQPAQLETLPLIRSNTTQIQADAAVSSNGLVCSVYTSTNGTNIVYKYAIADFATGQNIVAPTTIVAADSGQVTGSPRVFLLGNYFMIVFTATVTSANHLQYIAVNSISLIANAASDISSQYTAASTVAFDGVVANNSLYLAWNGSDGGGAIRMCFINSNLTQSNTITYTTSTKVTATIMSVCADTSGTTPNIYASYYNAGSSTGFTVAVDANLNKLYATPAQIISTGTITNITSFARNGSARIFYEVSSAYSYDSSIPSHYIQGLTVSSAGTVSSSYLVARSVGLASKAFTAGGRKIIVGGKSTIINQGEYIMVAYSSPYQPSYFLLNVSDGISFFNPYGGTNPLVVSKLAYSNGGGYLTLGLPGVSVYGNTASVSYLFKDQIAAVNKNTNVASGTQVAGVYSQLGVNLASFSITSSGLTTAEIGANLNIAGGIVWGYDGFSPVEQGFNLWPDSVEASIVADPAPTGTVSSSVTPTIITSLSSVVGIVPGMNISGTGIPANTTVVSVGTTTVTMSADATGSHSAETITFTGNVSAQQYYYQVTYEWTDNQGNAFRSAPSIPITVTSTSGHSSTVINVPTLRLTYKTAHPVKIVIYRWSVAQQVYYQTTSISQPLLNDLTVDSVSFTDLNSDATILGNNILYTTGGVVENIGAPPTASMTLFDDRFWVIDAEDRNLLWFSKQVIEATPVEMSDLLTMYVAPSIGVTGSTGIMRALGAMDDKLVIFKKGAIYYVNGTGPDNTGSNSQYSQPIFITAVVGSTNQNSIVFTPRGLMFQSDKGIWLLGRDLSTSYIGAPVEAFNGATVLSAVNIPETNQVRFTLDSGVTLMYDYYYDQWGTFVNVPGISSCIYQDLHTFINLDGQVFQETPGQYLDGSNPVLMGFTTSWLNMTGLQGYQRAFFFYLLGEYLSPHKLNLSIGYDYNPSPSQATLISPTNFNPAYGSSSPYGAGTYGGPAALERWRIFLKRQRCQAFQIKLQELYDGTFGIPAGAGLTLSGINVVYGSKSGFRPTSAQHSAG